MNAAVSLLGAALPATVHVHAEIPAAHPSAPILGVERMGTGTLVDSSGLVLTVSYVVMGASRLDVTLLDDRTYPGALVKYDFATGLALVRIDGDALPSLPLRRTGDLVVGTPVFVVASVGTGSARVADGVVTRIGPFEANWEYVLDRGLVTSVMNPGLGGGPLVDAYGRMLGVVSLDLNEVGRSTLAVPADCFLDAREAFLAADGRPTLGPRAWLGVFCHVLDARVVIAGLLDGGPGAAAGLRPGDVLLAVDDRELADRATLYRHLGALRPGDPVTLRIARDRDERSVTFAAGDAAAYFA